MSDGWSIVGSALAGGLKGLGEGMAASGKMDYEADLQRQRDEYLAKKEERMQSLRQQFEGGEKAKDREQQSTENALNRGQSAQQHTESMALGYSGQASQRQMHTETMAQGEKVLASHEKMAGMQIASHEAIARLNRDLQRETAKNMQIGDDGSVNVIVKDDAGNFVAKPVVDEDGDVFTSKADMSKRDESRVKALQALIKDDTELLQKSFDPKDKDSISARIKRYTSQIGKLLGMDDLVAPTTTGARKPLSSYLGGASGG